MGRRTAAPHGLAAAQGARGLTLDAGALMALERANHWIAALVEAFAARNGSIAVPAGALAQAWRASPRQHRLAVLLNDDEVEVPSLDLAQALGVGALLALTGTADVIDASVAVTARERRHWVVTSDAADLRRLDPDLPIIEV
jgi:hypothetical protein